MLHGGVSVKCQPVVLEVLRPKHRSSKFWCRLINRLSIILQKDLYKSSIINIYMSMIAILIIYIYVYIYSQNYDNTTIHYYVHFYCMITYNLLHVFSLHVSHVYNVAKKTRCCSFDFLSRCWQTQTAAGLNTDADTCTETTECNRCPGIEWLRHWSHPRLYWIKDTVYISIHGYWTLYWHYMVTVW